MKKYVALYLVLCGLLGAAWQCFAAGNTFVPMTGAGQSGPSGGGGGFTGAGDVVSGAVAYWGLRPYNAAYATGLGKLANICTPSDASCADVNSTSAGAFNLAGSGLTCDNASNKCTVKKLYDTSGAAFCTGSVACDVTQSTIANRPTLIVPGAANGCSTTSNYCMTNSTITTAGLQSVVIGTNLNQPYTVIAASDETSSAASNSLFTGNSVGGCSAFYDMDTGPNFNYFAGNTNLLLSISVNTWYGAAAQINDGSSVLYANGTSGGSANPGNAGISTSCGFGLGWDSFNTGGKINYTEVGVYSTGLNATQVGNIISNQRSFWGF